MSTALLFSAIVLAFRSDGFRSLFYDPTHGICMEALILAFFMVVIVREVASEVSGKDTTPASVKAIDPVPVKAEPKAAPKAAPRVEKAKPAPPKEISIEGMKTHAVVRIPEGVTKIEKRAFYGSKALTWVQIPSTVTEIGPEAFMGCSELKSVEITEGCLDKIGKASFQGCKSLTSITLPSKLQHVDEYAFCDCIELRTVEIKPGLRTMGATTFRGCPKLTAIEIPSGCSLQFSSD